MKKISYFFIILIFIIVLLLIFNIIYCNYTITVTNYELKDDKCKTNLHFVVLSDLHNKEYGKNNENLIKKVKETNPDFIAVLGDMVTRTIADDSIMKNVLTELAEIAPTYCVLGNHELSLIDRIDFRSDIESTGAQLLDNESIKFEKDGTQTLIGGLSDFPYYEGNAPEFDTPERYFWDEFRNEAEENDYSILLHHQPEYIGDISEGSGIDLILCGHTHGGLVRIPFIGGVIAPNQGLFPKLDKGEFDFGSTKMIITAGLGNSYPVPRINDPAEICVIDINPTDK